MGEILTAIGANISVIHIILFAAGIICLVIEMFEPGFGVFGGVGIALMIVDVIILADSIAQAAVLFLGVAVTILFFVLLFFILASYGILPKKLVLEASMEGMNSKGGTDAVTLGSVGVTVTRLCPAGKVEIDGRILDVVSNGEFIEQGQQVRVQEVSGNRIVVCKN